MLWRVNSPPVTPDSSNSTSFLFKTKPQSYEKSFAQWRFWLSNLRACFVCLGKHVGFDMWSHGLKITTNHYFKSSLSESLCSRRVLVCCCKPPLAKIPVSAPRSTGRGEAFPVCPGWSSPGCATAKRLILTPQCKAQENTHTQVTWTILLE